MSHKWIHCQFNDITKGDEEMYCLVREVDEVGSINTRTVKEAQAMSEAWAGSLHKLYEDDPHEPQCDCLDCAAAAEDDYEAQHAEEI